MFRHICTTALFAFVALGGFTPTTAQEPTAAQDRPGFVRARERAVAFLVKKVEEGGLQEFPGQDGGVPAIVTLALLESGIKPDDPRTGKLLEEVRALKPKTTYVMSLQTLVLCAAEPKKDLDAIRRNVKWLEETQLQTKLRPGAWSYGSTVPPAAREIPGDNSNTQFAMLALQEADLVGVPAAEQTWRLALEHWLSGQREDGSWGYKRPNPGTGSMTCAGIACVSAAARCVKDKASFEAAQSAIRRGELWLAKHFTVEANRSAATGDIGLWHFCYLYDLERAARLTGRASFGGHDWRQEGADWLLKQQDGDGGWTGSGHAETDPVLATSLALLFLRPEAADKPFPEVAPHLPMPVRSKRRAADAKFDPAEKSDRQPAKANPSAGMVTWVSLPNKLLWINLGRGDGLQPGARFDVYSADVKAGAKAVKKGTVEVTRIEGEHTAQARIFDDKLVDPIMCGDKAVAPGVPVTPEPPQSSSQVAPSGPTLEKQLSRPVKKLSLPPTPLANVVRLAASIGSLQVSYDPDAMQELGVTLRDPITINASGATVATLLDKIAAARGMAVEIDHGQILLTSKAEFRNALRTVPYTVSDLTAGDAHAAAELARLIQRFVLPEAWQLAGGEGSIEVSPDVLRIKQSGRVHHHILVFCEKLRVARGLPTRSHGDPKAFSMETRSSRAKTILDQIATIDIGKMTTLSDILDQVKQPAGMEIFIDRPALVAAGISENIAAKLRSENLPQVVALRQLLQSLGLAWRVVDANTLQLTTSAVVAARLELEFYPPGKQLAGQPPEALIERIRSGIHGAAWDGDGATGAIVFDPPSQCLLVLQTQPAQAAIEALLAQGANKAKQSPHQSESEHFPTGQVPGIYLVTAIDDETIELKGAGSTSHKASIKDLDFYNAAGTKLTAEELEKRSIKVGSVVVASADENPVDPAYLSILKDDTLVLTGVAVQVARADRPGRGWTMDLTKMKPYDGPVVGKVDGKVFKLDKIELGGPWLNLHSGNDAIMMVLTFNAAQGIQGKAYEISAESAQGRVAPRGPAAPGDASRRPGSRAFSVQAIHVHMMSSEASGGDSAFGSRYSMRLEFGNEKDGQIPGKIYLCWKDKRKSWIAGNFSIKTE